MSPNLKENIKSVKNNIAEDYHLMAMSILASGAISADEAIDFAKR